MVIRSLVARSLLYAVAVVALSVPPAMWVGQLLMEQGRHEQFRSFIQPQMEGLSRVVAQLPAAPTPTQLADLGALSHHHLTFVPWSASNSYPAALTRQPLLIDEHDRPNEAHHWLRVERNGRPIGAIELTPNMPEFRRGNRGPNADLAWGWILLLLVVIVPPLWLWLLRPLRTMTAVAHRLGGGDLETPVRVTRRDEFGELEAAFERMRVELRRAMDQKERLLSDVSHELRGPLARMTLALPLIRMRAGEDPMIDLVSRELKNADELLGQVLDLARGRRPAAMPREPIDLATVAAHVIAERALVAERSQITLEAHCEPAWVLGNARSLEAALGNLVDNALKYSGAGGHVRVATGCVGERARMLVQDDGPGIAQQHLAQIFEPFYRPDDSRSRETGGSGLGLSIVRAVADAHQGSAELASTEGAGTTATVMLPAIPAPTAGAPAPAESTSAR